MKEIQPEEVLKQTNKRILDVREREEVAEGAISGSVNIPLSTLEVRLHELDKNEEYIVVCRSGARSAKATAFLEKREFNVINMIGGMMNWKGPIK